MLYMLTRLIVNLSQTYLAMYLINTLGLHKVAVAAVSGVTSQPSPSLHSAPPFFFAPTEVYCHDPISHVSEWIPVLLHHEANQQDDWKMCK